MKLAVFLAFATLLIAANCQQAITMENCLYDVGIVVADASLYYRDRSNPQTIYKFRQDIATLYRECLSVLPASLESAPFNCEALLIGIENLSAEKLAQAHLQYKTCVENRK